MGLITASSVIEGVVYGFQGHGVSQDKVPNPITKQSRLK